MEVIEPRIGASDRATVLYLHGGGYALGSARGYRGLVGRLAEAGALRAVYREYSRSPETPFPTALYEARDAYRQLLEDGIEPHRIVVAGDSAGGGLALALVMLLRDEGAPLPAALGLICPWLNLACDAMGTRIERHDPLISTSMTAEWVRAYAGDTPCEHPGISPVLGKVNGLPPIVVHSAGDDPLTADAELLEALPIEQSPGHALEHRTYPNRWHDFHLQAGFLKDADEAIQHMGRTLAVFTASGAERLASDQPRL